jgi:hypothetical protein
MGSAASCSPGTGTRWSGHVNGYYTVVFDRDISECAYQPTVGRPGIIINPGVGFEQVANRIGDTDNGVAVFTRDEDGAAVQIEASPCS